MLILLNYKFIAIHTFSPISVSSPAGSIWKSALKAHASITLLYTLSFNDWPNNILSLSDIFWIQACCGTYAIDP